MTMTKGMDMNENIRMNTDLVTQIVKIYLYHVITEIEVN
jgi:hypothetical protein